MNERQHLSIIITTKNRIEDLKKCVEAVQRSTFVGYELIIIDDYSIDGTQNLNKKDLRIEKGDIYHAREPLMMVKARNFGARKASGDLLLFIDDDNSIDQDMVRILVEAAMKKKEYGILGPTMCLKDGRKYLDYQTFNLFTGKTTGKIWRGEGEVYDSDGIPNVFLIKREVFEKAGYFDEGLIQTFTELDFALHARAYGYRCGMISSARTLHNVSDTDTYAPRKLGGQFKQKAYCLMRNRSVAIVRYGRWYHKMIYFICFSLVWPSLYSLLMVRYKRFDLVVLYWRGFFDGLYYYFTGQLRMTALI